MIIALNNKSNLNKYEFLDYQRKLSTLNTNSKIITCPTLLNINLYNVTKFSLGAQNVSINDEGAYTGEVSAKDLNTSGVEYCIVGHSERRAYQRETDEEINEKIKKLFENNITPILCVGETKEQRENLEQANVIINEVTKATKDLTTEEKSKLIVAYEPVWSIGTGLVPTLEQIDEIISLIKSLLPYSKVLYGGSANEKNISMLKESNLIDGYLLGGLSLKVDKLQEFINILEG